MKTLALSLALALTLSPCFADDPGSPSSAQNIDGQGSGALPQSDTLDGQGSGAPEPPSVPLVTTLLSDGSTNTWSQADLVAALQLMNRKYHRDVKTYSGRVKWHGKRVSSVTDAEAFTVTETYEDGTVFVDAAPVKTPALSVAERNAKLKTTMTNGVPVKLARARLARAAEKSTTNTVTTVLTPTP